MIRAFLHYLFPYIPLRHRTPLLPLHYSSEHSRRKDEYSQVDISLIKGMGLARTDSDARRVLKRYPGSSFMEIQALEKRRRRHNKIARAIKRFKRLWTE